MLILYTAQSCSTAGEVISTALYCKHWSYSPGERSKLKAAEKMRGIKENKQQKQVDRDNQAKKNPLQPYHKSWGLSIVPILRYAYKLSSVVGVV